MPCLYLDLKLGIGGISIDGPAEISLEYKSKTRARVKIVAGEGVRIQTLPKPAESLPVKAHECRKSQYQNEAIDSCQKQSLA